MLVLDPVLLLSLSLSLASGEYVRDAPLLPVGEAVRPHWALYICLAICKIQRNNMKKQ